MKQLTISPMYLLVAAADSEMPAGYAAKLVLELVEPTELKAEMYEAVEQAYAGLNPDYGDYMKKVLLAVIAAEGEKLQAETARQLMAIELEISRAESLKY
jgi:hypothetical protein